MAYEIAKIRDSLGSEMAAASPVLILLSSFLWNQFIGGRNRPSLKNIYTSPSFPCR